MLRCSGSSQNPVSSVLDELHLSNGLLWKAGDETITIIHIHTLKSLRGIKWLRQHVNLLNRAGYRVRYFLGTDRIASIPSSIEKRVFVRYQILISSTSESQ